MRRHIRAREAGDVQVARHADNEQRDCERRANQHQPLLAVDFGLPRRAFSVDFLALVRAGQIQHAVACRFHRLDQIASAYRTGKVFHRCFFGGKVHVDFEHAERLFQRALDVPHARGTGHPRDRQFHRCLCHAVARAVNLLDQRVRVYLRRVVSNARPLGGEVDHHLADAFGLF